ncbi:MAG: hypothetical protein IKU05_05430 [Bacteroidales bacterium]|nr:hypothetical protein [Bacteroidales bacterium]MBR6438045.1 hypothetical protein [Bacteroidales bacterium]
MIVVELSKRYLSAFGCIPSGYPDTATIEDNIKAGIERAALNIGRGRANIGIMSANMRRFVTNVNGVSWANFTLRNGGTYYKFANTLFYEELPGVLAPPPMVSFTRDKNIKKTSIDGSDFEVVECFGLKPWKITISGILIDMDNHQYPSSKMRSFRTIFETNDIFDVLESQIFEDLGIQSIYIERLDELKVLEDYQDTVQFKMTAYSIKPLEFFI